MDLFLAESELQTVVANFNAAYREWEKKHNCGANFGFHYEPVSGNKNLVYIDFAATDAQKPSDAQDPRLEKAAKIIETAGTMSGTT